MLSNLRMARTAKRPSTRHILGQRLMGNVPAYRLQTGGIASVTAARRYVACNQIKAPAVLYVKCSESSTHRYYWSANGMYSALYVELNYVNFPCLLNYNAAKGFFDLMQCIEVPNEVELQDYKPEFAFI